MPPASETAKPAPNTHGRLNGGQTIPSRRGSTKVVLNPAKPVLSAEASATLRDHLVAELKEITSSDDAAIWAHRILDAKNGLTEADARQIEDAFRAKLETLEGTGEVSDQPLSPVLSAPQPSSSPLMRQPVGPAGTSSADGIDKSRLARPEPRRFRDKEHVKFVAKPACLICGRRPADANHLRFTMRRHSVPWARAAHKRRPAEAKLLRPRPLLLQTLRRSMAPPFQSRRLTALAKFRSQSFKACRTAPPEYTTAGCCKIEA